MDDAGGLFLEAVRETTATRQSATDLAARADKAWREAIVTAVKAGESAIDIAAAAGISRFRVYQIRDGRR